MIIPDVNLLVYSYNSDAKFHPQAKVWLEETLTKGLPFGLPWAVALGFIRIMTDNRILEKPMEPGEAVGHVQSWLDCPGVTILEPGHRHLEILSQLFAHTQLGGKLTTDTHIAALAIEHHAEIHSNDRDFDRFEGLRWKNPLVS